MYEYQKTADQVADDIAKAYIKATDYINSEIEKIFRTFRLEGGLTESEARQLLNHIPDDVKLDSLKAVVNQIKDPVKKQKILNVINSTAYAYRIQRFEELQKDIDDKVTQLYKVEQNATKSHYIDLAEDAYYRTIFDIQKGTGLGFSFSSMSTSRVDEILKKKWSGKLFSERIWGRTKEINNAIQEELYVQFMTGRSYLKTSAEIQERMSVGAMEARRLVRTESAYISNSAELESYKECGIEEFRFIATLDMRTSELCASMDGKRFKVEDGVPGENVPPLHPWCRSTTAAVIDGEVTEGLERRARDPETGKTYLVPADMTYEEWKKSINEKYGEGYFETERKKVLNYSSDKKQYEKYKSVLGAKNVPQSFDKFQELKYNDKETWRFIKIDYKRRNELIKNPELVLPNAKNATADDRKFTEYLFGGTNKIGLSKGRAFENRLGYNIDNYTELKDEILKMADKYPASPKNSDVHGFGYEQKIIVYGYKNKPANVVIGWKNKGGKTWLTTAYIKEVDEK